MQFDSPLADRLTAVVLFVLGAAMLYGGWVMDRLEVRHIHPASIPGLVPMLLGAAMMVAAAVLFLGARRTAAGEGDGGVSWPDVAVAGVWSLIFALGLVSRVPFIAAVTVYVAGFVLWFGWPRGAGTGRKLWAAAFAAGFALVVAVAVAGLFRYGFLVRLP